MSTKERFAIVPQWAIGPAEGALPVLVAILTSYSTKTRKASVGFHRIAQISGLDQRECQAHAAFLEEARILRRVQDAHFSGRFFPQWELLSREEHDRDYARPKPRPKPARAMFRQNGPEFDAESAPFIGPVFDPLVRVRRKRERERAERIADKRRKLERLRKAGAL